MGDSLSITNIIIGLTAIISIYAFSNHDLMYKWIFSPYQARYHKQYYRFITHGFLHANWMHLLVNVFVLYSFGNAVEGTFAGIFGIKGLYYFIMLYLGGLIVSSIPSYVKHHNDPAYQSLGASGAVSAVLFAAILLSPFTEIVAFLVIPMPAIIFGLLYVGYEYWAGRQMRDNINHDAHLMGGLYGILFTIVIKPQLLLNFIDQITYYIKHL